MADLCILNYNEIYFYHNLTFFTKAYIFGVMILYYDYDTLWGYFDMKMSGLCRLMNAFSPYDFDPL